jgi:hypothetical protein
MANAVEFRQSDTKIQGFSAVELGYQLQCPAMTDSHKRAYKNEEFKSFFKN